jgi:hypothetical protein
VEKDDFPCSSPTTNASQPARSRQGAIQGAERAPGHFQGGSPHGPGDGQGVDPERWPVPADFLPRGFLEPSLTVKEHALDVLVPAKGEKGVVIRSMEGDLLVPRHVLQQFRMGPCAVEKHKKRR